MTTLAARTVLREWNVLQPFCTYLPRCKLSTAVERNEEVANADVRSLIDPLTHPDFFQVHDLFTVTDLFEARVHLGHKIGSLHNNMRPFIFGNRLSHLVIDLDQTAELLRDALNFTAHIAFRDGIILFVTRSPQNSYIVDKTAKECEEFSHTRYWKSGTLTNATRQFGTITRLPDLCIFFSTLDSVLHQHPAVQQMAKMCIPTAGIVDTNCDPNLITYPVPGNDDTPCAIQLYCRLFKEAIMRGKTARKLISQRTSEI